MWFFWSQPLSTESTARSLDFKLCSLLFSIIKLAVFRTGRFVGAVVGV